MKVSVNKLDALKRELDIEVSQDRVKQKFDAVYEEIKKSAKIPGFRPGTAPRNILEKHHSKLAQEEVIRQLLPETYEDALKKENLDVISLPEITDVNLGATLRYKAKVEIRPDIDVKDYKNIKIKKRSNEVKSEDLEKALDNIKKLRKVDAIGDDFAHGLGYSSLDEFKEALKRQLVIQKESENKMQLEREVIDHLLKNAKFTVPESLVARRLHELHHEVHDYFAKNNMPKEEIEKKEKELEPKLKDQALEEVRIFLVLDEIAKLEKISRDDHMPNSVMEFLFKNAEWVA
ncbi:MAG: trigger factor [Candidatus Omnitrophica bacterium]|nr:trigger factor [Candidatus Omnitrophota bacterium]MDD5351850.1 trigger factor [Candidatus Omnitrophota bacterium]MDD5550676.1 trigger factor [Candidatus Omnitrophota bacterium]